VFVDKARCGTVYPKEVPYLQRIQPKDPISLENLGYVRQLHLISAHILAGIQCQSNIFLLIFHHQGPRYMSTETQAKYHAMPNVQSKLQPRTQALRSDARTSRYERQNGEPGYEVVTYFARLALRGILLESLLTYTLVPGGERLTGIYLIGIESQQECVH
jgi:hypothetical protein